MVTMTECLRACKKAAQTGNDQDQLTASIFLLAAQAEHGENNDLVVQLALKMSYDLMEIARKRNLVEVLFV